LFDESGQHINRAGYELWKKIIAPHLDNSAIAPRCSTSPERQTENKQTDPGRDRIGNVAHRAGP
jgi:hypothetical protein